MSLVAYGSSGEESDSGEEISSKQGQRSAILPKTFSNVAAKKQRESVKITIPSLKQFEEEGKDEVPKKKTKFQSRSGSGLFSLLPPPKNSTTLSQPGFVPYIFSKKEKKSSPVTKNNTPSLKKTNISPTPDQDSDDDIATETEKKSENESTSTLGTTDFFSLDTKTEISKHNYDTSNYLGIDIPPASSQDKPFDIQQSYNPPLSSPSSSIDPTSIQEEVGATLYSQQYQVAPLTDSFQNGADCQSEYSDEPNPTDALLKDKEFLKLQGRRREFEGIDIIDVNAADQVSDRNEWLMKSLTEETTHRPSRKKHLMPTSQQKRKHQITYLAFQAKERELDLKNQWALNSRTRRETQAKYGF